MALWTEDSDPVDTIQNYTSSSDEESMCGCGIPGGCAEYQHCLEAKLLVLEDLYITIDQKRKAEEKLEHTQETTRMMEEAMKNAEEKAELAHEATRKMEEAMKKAERKAELADEATRKMEEAMKKIEDEKMEIKLHLADIVHDNKIKADASAMKMKRIKRYAIEKEVHLHYAFGAIVILIAVVIAMLGFLRCSR